MTETSMLSNSLTDFGAALASKAAVPGGGGASAAAGALGAALASMVCNLTYGKKKYAEYESDISRILEKAEKLRINLLDCIDGDAKSFEPLSKAYSIPKDNPDRDCIMEKALKDACSVPLEIMELCSESIQLHRELAEKGSTIAISDVGVGVMLSKAALIGASLNVLINAKSMKDREYAGKILTKMNNLLDSFCAMADEAYKTVVYRITG